MYACPSCRTPSIPWWRALVPDLKVFNFDCPCCGAKLRRSRSIKDAVIGIPLIASFVYARQFERIPVDFVIYTFGVASLAGLFLWMLTIRYEVVEQEIAFVPHSNELKNK